MANLVEPAKLPGRDFSLEAGCRHQIEELAEAVVKARQENKPVIGFSGAHLIKNGLGPVLVDLVERGVLLKIGAKKGTYYILK